MSEETEEKFGRIIYNGRIVDVDSLSEEELEKLINELEKKCEKLENEIDNILEVED